MAQVIDSERREEVEELFDAADADGDQRINFEEFRKLLADLDPGVPRDVLELGFRQIDTDHDQRIDFAEFLAWWSEP